MIDVTPKNYPDHLNKKVAVSVITDSQYIRGAQHTKLDFSYFNLLGFNENNGNYKLQPLDGSAPIERTAFFIVCDFD